MYQRRLNSLKEKMEKKGIDAAILQYHVDIFYFSGINQRSTLVIPLEKDPVLLVQVGMEEVKKESWIRNIRILENIQSLKVLLRELKLTNATLGINEDIIFGSLYKRMCETFPDAILVNISPIVEQLRKVKSEEEISLIKKASEISFRGHKRVKEVLKEGVSELELAAEVEMILRKLGHTGVLFRKGRGSFPPGGYGVIGPSGSNLGVISGTGDITITGKGLSLAFPFGASRRKISRGDMVMADIGTNFEGYHSDECRMYVVGKPDGKQKTAFKLVSEALEAAIDNVRAGVKGKDVYFAAKELIDKAGYSDYFAAFKDYPAYSYLGHGVGLEIGEPPFITPKDETIFEVNMVVALEPKLIAPNWGVSLEDTILVTDNGCELLTMSPRGLMEV